VNKAEIIDSVSARLDLAKRDVTDVVDAFIEETKKALVRGEKVAVSGFGVFEASHRKARLGRNPRTGETVKIKATKIPKFRPGTEFKAVVNGSKKVETKAGVKKAAPKKAVAKKVVKKAAPKKAVAKKVVKKAAPKKAAAKKTTRR
jgi:DNA-binding protein HU-beta